MGSVCFFINYSFALPAPSQISKFIKEAVQQRSIQLSWQEPHHANGAIKEYEIKYYEKVSLSQDISPLLLHTYLITSLILDIKNTKFEIVNFPLFQMFMCYTDLGNEVAKTTGHAEGAKNRVWEAKQNGCLLKIQQAPEHVPGTIAPSSPEGRLSNGVPLEGIHQRVDYQMVYHQIVY